MRIFTSDLLDKIPRIFKNKIFLILTVYLVYLLFFNQYNLISQFKLYMELKSLNEEQQYFRKLIEDAKDENKKIFKNQNTLEQFAREKYWMKKDSEEVYILVEKEK